jgi:glycine/D-amino acid oxidase-like deaminating enzyme
MDKKIIIVGAGVAGINAATKLVDNGYPGELITIIDMGKDPYNRLPEEVMTGMLGAGGWSDGKLTYHTAIGGQLSKYCGEDKAMELMDQVITNFQTISTLNQRRYIAQTQKQNLNLLNHILDYVYSLYGILVQIIYLKLLKTGMII